jgi:hypothetical protein
LRRKWRVVANLISLTGKGWGRNPPQTPRDAASKFLDDEFNYQFTGRIKHPGLKKGRVLIFRFMKTVIGEAVFDRWLAYDTMHCVQGKAYPIPLLSGDYVPRSANRYMPLSMYVISEIREVASRVDQGGYVKTEEEESTTTHRIGQGEIRRRALIRYGAQCALCKVDSPQLLVAGHIKGWSKGENERGQDENVILMCSLHDSLFGKGFLTLDYPSYRVNFCRKALSPAASRQIKSATSKFRTPGRGAPAKRYLTWHKNYIFAKPLKQQ